MQEKDYHFFQFDKEKVIEEIGKDKLIEALKEMLLIRNFEERSESAYQMGKIGGFLHLYIGQEAIQVGSVLAMGKNHWYTTTYRCHALALLLGASPNELMAELYGKETGNSLGRGGSMHFFTDHMLGGFAIVGGHIPVATGAGFTIKYKEKKNKASICYFGDGAVAQGSFHEALNLASLWDLPVIYVIENNHWGMGTATKRAICTELIAEKKAPGYNMEAYTLDGFDFFSCYAGFKEILKKVTKTSRPVLVEILVDRFKGHSVSDPGLYRSKENLEEAKKRDPILLLKNTLLEKKMITEDFFIELNDSQKKIVKESMDFAEKSDFPKISELEKGVFK